MYAGLSFSAVNEYTWNVAKPKSDLTIQFNVWNFINQVNSYA